jgi:cytochrome c-type biogenesis protein CcmH/NrfF
MALLDTFSFVKTFRNAANDEDRAAAIASLVNGLVESNGAAAATRADLARVAGDVVKIEQRVSALGEELAVPVTQKLDSSSASIAKEMTTLREQMQERLQTIEARMETLNRELGNRVEMNSDKLGGTGRKVIFWNFLFLLLLGAAGLYAALNWPAVNGMFQQALKGVTTEQTPAATPPAQ